MKDKSNNAPKGDDAVEVLKAQAAELKDELEIALRRLREADTARVELEEELAKLRKDHQAVAAEQETATPLVVRQTVALGNGTRKAGTRLGTITLAKGVELGEIATLLRNEQLLRR